VDYIHPDQDRRTMVGSCKHGNGPSGSIKSGVKKDFCSINVDINVLSSCAECNWLL
jgi:hypothetical protein